MKILPLRFKDEETLEYVKLVCRRKHINLPEYIVGNFEWDNKPLCISRGVAPDQFICPPCDYKENCPDGVKK
jgi:hypothetical protein